MNPPATAKIRVGAWCVDPTAGQISRGGEVVRVEARTLRLLLDLAGHAGEVVSIDDLLDRVWAGVIVTPDSVYQAVASLRRLLGDDPKRPSYIATVPRLGYRLVARVGPWTDDPVATAPDAPGSRAPMGRRGWLILAAVTGMLGAGLAYEQTTRAHGVAPRAVSVGVLPFLDLTDSMDQEILVDEVTEGLVDKLSHQPALRTPGFRASFDLKGKHASVAEAARRLGVAYVVDGSVRKSRTQLRIAARLMRADTGFVVWSQTYDRPLAELPAVQDAIAVSVAGALAGARPAT